MAITIGLGWWLVPSALTLAAFIWAGFMCRDEGHHGDYAVIGNAMVALAAYGAAIIVSLLSWLIWAVLT